MNKLIATIKKNSIDEIQIGLTEFKVHDLINIRVYTEIENGKDMVPTKKGLTCNVKLLPDLIKALNEAEQVAIKEGLIYEKKP